jgi:TolB-like protein
LSGDPEQDYFADGVVEDIISALSRVGWLFVIARNSSFSYKGRTVDIKQVGRELGGRYVLEGSVRKASNRVRITGQLVDAMGRPLRRRFGRHFRPPGPGPCQRCGYHRTQAAERGNGTGPA